MPINPVINPLGEVTVPERPAVLHPHVATTFLRMRREPKPVNERTNPADEHEWFRELTLTVRGGYNSDTQTFIAPEDLALLSEADRAKCRPLTHAYPSVDALGEQWPVVGLVMLLVNNAAPRLLLLDEVLLPQLAALDAQIAAASGAKVDAEQALATAQAAVAALPGQIAAAEAAFAAMPEDATQEQRDAAAGEVLVLTAQLAEATSQAASLPATIAELGGTLTALGVQRDALTATIAPVQSALTDVPAALAEAMGG